MSGSKIDDRQPDGPLEGDMSWGGGLGDGCGSDIGEGFRQIIDACKHDPTLFINILSLGTIVQHSIDNSEYSTDKSFIVRAKEDFIIFAGRDYILTSNGTYRLDVAGDGVLTFNGDYGVNVGGSWQGSINGGLNLNVDHDVSINADNVAINGIDIDVLDSRVKDNADGIVALDIRVKDNADGLVALSAKVNSLTTAVSNLNGDLADMSSAIQSLISRVGALEEAVDSSTTDPGGGGTTTPPPAAVVRPRITLPESNTTLNTVDFSVHLTPFETDPPDSGDRVIRSEWQISIDHTYTQYVNSFTKYAHETDPTLAYIRGLDPDTMYYIRARYVSNMGVTSEWSVSTFRIYTGTPIG